MKTKSQKNRLFVSWERYLIAGVILISFVLIIFADETLLVAQEDSAMRFLGVYVGLSLVTLIVNRRALVITMFGVTGLLALFLKLNLDANVSFVASNHTEQLNVQLINLDQVRGDAIEFDDFLKVLDMDVLFFQSYSPKWKVRLDDALKNDYPYHNRLDRIDLYGQYIRSKRPITNVDTFIVEDIPVIRLGLKLNDFDEVRIMSIFLPPALTRNYEKQQERIINQLNKIHSNSRPTIYVGNLNLTPWSDNLQYFRYKTNSKCSRLRKSKLNLIQENPFEYYPSTHILYNQKFQNTHFAEVELNSIYIGVEGSYQIKI